MITSILLFSGSVEDIGDKTRGKNHFQKTSDAEPWTSALFSFLPGRNGTGKSTLLRAMAGLAESDSGSVTCAKSARAVYPWVCQMPRQKLCRHFRTAGAGEV